MRGRTIAAELAGWAAGELSGQASARLAAWAAVGGVPASPFGRSGASRISGAAKPASQADVARPRGALAVGQGFS